MPIYEYHCAACDKNHEIIQRVNDAPLLICPACGGKLEKKLSLSSFQLKGGGWYKEGYASTPKSAEKPEEKPGAKPEDKPKKEPEKKEPEKK